ncbi:hypothetical protein PFLUV_G00034880 [Perca fluviatilis]|uniref:Uncharacterized protein n=1 Tax=Perca fluviatilis TaxID=8168 RepID=A0A6A5FP39_PERFL|nr:hypothetical protein PFLUV_G00034880 [Perca fluviatilis]
MRDTFMERLVWKPDVESSRAVSDRVAAGQITKCLWPRFPRSRTPLRTDSLVRLAPTPVGWPRVTRETHF